MQDFKKLEVWEKSHKLALEVYKISGLFPKVEDYRYTSQLLRAITSIPTNIAEGCGRSTSLDQARFMQIAIGSASECEYLFILGKDLGYIDGKNYESLSNELIETRKMMINLKKKMVK